MDRSPGINTVRRARARNALNVPYRWLIRPRFLLYAAIPIALGTGFPILEPLTAILTAILAMKVLSGFLALRRALE
jgi:hypothetical protein